MTNDLQLIESTLTLPGITPGTRCIQISPSTPDEALIQAAERLTLVTDFSQWALAALLSELQARKGESWLNQFCDARGIHPKYRRELLWVHTFYPPSSRTIPLDYEYYREAQHQAYDGKTYSLPTALSHLSQAASSNWSVGQMRKTLRSSQAESIPPPTAPLSDYQAVHSFARFAHQELPRLAQWSRERIKLTLSDLADAPHFLDQLRTLAKHKGIK